MFKKTFVIFSLLLLVYMLWPGPSKISDFPALPSSDKSKLEGDTIQIPNVSAYFSDNFRDFVTTFYSKAYWKKTLLPFPPLKLNHPPEFSWITIKKHTDSTYLEELVYPLRDSLFVNGLEPFTNMGEPRWWGATKFEASDNLNPWFTKATLRFYPSSILVRIFVWFGITIFSVLIYRLGKKIIFNL